MRRAVPHFLALAGASAAVLAAALAHAQRKPVLAFAGSIVDNSDVDALFDAVFGIVDRPATREDAMRNAAEYLERAARRAARGIALGRKI